jgi:hypothetical protein
VLSAGIVFCLLPLYSSVRGNMRNSLCSLT